MLIINLRDTSPAYGQGDEVAGQAIYSPGNPQLSSQPVRIVVELVGRTKTKFKKGDDGPYRGRADLLRVTVGDMCGSQRVWPFVFIFPLQASPNLTQLAILGKGMPALGPYHPLPPTFKDQRPTFKVFTEYNIVASAWSVGERAQKLCEQTVPITFQPWSQQQDLSHTMRDVIILQEIFIAQSLRLLPQNKNRDLTFREKASSIFSPSKLPFFSFRIRFQLPQKTYLQENIPCMISVTPQPEASAAPEIPDFVLKRFSITIDSDTTACASRVFDHSVTKHQRILDSTERNVDELLVSHAGYCKEIIIPALSNVSQTFDTFNIKRVYTLTVDITIKCAGKAFCLSKSTNLLILPRIRRGLVNAPVEASGPGVVHGKEMSQDSKKGSGPPPYSESG